MLSHLYPYSSTMMKMIGMWPPPSTEITLKNIISILYASFISPLALTFNVTLSIQMIICVIRAEQFMDISFMCCTMHDICVKVILMAGNHEYFRNLWQFFQAKERAIESDAEQEVQQKFNSIIKMGSQFTIILVFSTVFMISLGSLLEDIPRRRLPFKAWTLWNITQDGWYFFTISYQIIAHAVSAFISVTFNLMFMTTLLQYCAQIAILKHRLCNFNEKLDTVISKIPASGKMSSEQAEKSLMIKYIEHQLDIYQFVQYTNDVFRPAIFVQFSMTSLVICASIFTLSMLKPLSSEFMGLLFYLFCMLNQLFLFCACGNEVTLQVKFYINFRKCRVLTLMTCMMWLVLFKQVIRMVLQSLSISDAAYSMNWHHLSLQTQKSILFIIIRSRIALEIRSGHVVILSLDLFSNILRLSYSIYNVLVCSK